MMIMSDWEASSRTYRISISRSGTITIATVVIIVVIIIMSLSSDSSSSHSSFFGSQSGSPLRGHQEHTPPRVRKAEGETDRISTGRGGEGDHRSKSLAHFAFAFGQGLP